MKQFAVVGLGSAGDLLLYCRRCYISTGDPEDYRRAAVAERVSLEGVDADDLVDHNAAHHATT